MKWECTLCIFTIVYLVEATKNCSQRKDSVCPTLTNKKCRPSQVKEAHCTRSDDCACPKVCCVTNDCKRTCVPAKPLIQPRSNVDGGSNLPPVLPTTTLKPDESVKQEPEEYVDDEGKRDNPEEEHDDKTAKEAPVSKTEANTTSHEVNTTVTPKDGLNLTIPTVSAAAPVQVQSSNETLVPEESANQNTTASNVTVMAKTLPYSASSDNETQTHLNESKASHDVLDVPKTLKSDESAIVATATKTSNETTAQPGSTAASKPPTPTTSKPEITTPQTNTTKKEEGEVYKMKADVDLEEYKRKRTTTTRKPIPGDDVLLNREVIVQLMSVIPKLLRSFYRGRTVPSMVVKLPSEEYLYVPPLPGYDSNKRNIGYATKMFNPKGKALGLPWYKYLKNTRPFGPLSPGQYPYPIFMVLTHPGDVFNRLPEQTLPSLEEFLFRMYPPVFKAKPEEGFVLNGPLTEPEETKKESEKH